MPCQSCLTTCPRAHNAVQVAAANVVAGASAARATKVNKVNNMARVRACDVTLFPHSFPMLPHKLCCHMRHVHVQVLVVVVVVGAGWQLRFFSRQLPKPGKYSISFESVSNSIIGPFNNSQARKYCYYTPQALRWQVPKPRTPRLQPEEDAPVTASYFEPKMRSQADLPSSAAEGVRGPWPPPG